MELINWSLNAIDTIFSTRRAGSGEPTCPDGTFPAGYTLDGWEKWRSLCLASLHIEDVEDVYSFGFQVVSALFLSIGGALIYRKIGKVVAARKLNPLVSTMYSELGRAIQSLTAKNIELQSKVDDLTSKVDNILVKLDALQGARSMSM